MLISQVTLFIKNTNEWKPRAGADEAGVTSAQKGIIRPQFIQQPRDNHSSKSLQMPLECSHFSISKGASASRSHDRRIDQQYSGPTGVLPYWRWSRKEGMQAERCTALGKWMCKKMFLKKTPDRTCTCKFSFFFHSLLVSRTFSEVTYLVPLRQQHISEAGKSKTQQFHLSSSKGICQHFLQATTLSSDRKLHSMTEDASVTPCAISTAVGQTHWLWA